MARGYVATWRNVGDGGALMSAYNQGASAATEQISKGLQGVGNAFTQAGERDRELATSDAEKALMAAGSPEERDALIAEFAKDRRIDGNTLFTMRNQNKTMQMKAEALQLDKDEFANTVKQNKITNERTDKNAESIRKTQALAREATTLEMENTRKQSAAYESIMGSGDGSVQQSEPVTAGASQLVQGAADSSTANTKPNRTGWIGSANRANKVSPRLTASQREIVKRKVDSDMQKYYAENLNTTFGTVNTYNSLVKTTAALIKNGLDPVIANRYKDQYLQDNNIAPTASGRIKQAVDYSVSQIDSDIANIVNNGGKNPSSAELVEMIATAAKKNHVMAGDITHGMLEPLRIAVTRESALTDEKYYKFLEPLLNAQNNPTISDKMKGEALVKGAKFLHDQAIEQNKGQDRLGLNDEDAKYVYGSSNIRSGEAKYTAEFLKAQAAFTAKVDDKAAAKLKTIEDGTKLKTKWEDKYTLTNAIKNFKKAYPDADKEETGIISKLAKRANTDKIPPELFWRAFENVVSFQTGTWDNKLVAFDGTTDELVYNAVATTANQMKQTYSNIYPTKEKPPKNGGNIPPGKDKPTVDKENKSVWKQTRTIKDFVNALKDVEYKKRMPTGSMASPGKVISNFKVNPKVNSSPKLMSWIKGVGAKNIPNDVKLQLVKDIKANKYTPGSALYATRTRNAEINKAMVKLLEAAK